MNNPIEKDICRILKTLEKAVDLPAFSLSDMSADELNMTEERWAKCLSMLAADKYIAGIRVYKNVMGEIRVQETTGICLTVSGLTYLRENSTMQKVLNAAKGIVELIP